MSDIDFAKQTVTLADPWASVSFLLPGHNLIGVRARAYVGSNKGHYLELSFPDFVKAFHGVVNGNELVAPTLQVIDKIYPEISQSDNYLFWRYSRFLTGGFDMAFATTIEIMGRGDLVSKPRLRLLKLYGDDILTGLPSNFALEQLGVQVQKGKEAEARAAFFRRLDQYASTFPWALKWILVQRSKIFSELPTRLAIVDRMLKSDPNDVDFQLERAMVLLDLGRPDDARSQLAASRVAWDRETAASINLKPAERAIDAFFANNFGRAEENIFSWRYARIVLLDAMARLAKDPKAVSAQMISQLQKKLGDKVLVGLAFFPEVVHLLHTIDDRTNELALVRAMLTVSGKLEESAVLHIADGLFRYFTIDRSIDEMPNDPRSGLRSSRFKEKLCEHAYSEVVAHQQQPLVASLRKFCGFKPN